MTTGSVCGPATVSTPRAVIRKSPSPLPVHHVRDRTPERSRSPVRKSRPTTRTERYSFKDSDSASCSRSSHSSRSADRWPDSPLDFRAAIQADDMEKKSSVSDGEDEGSSRKVSSAQYALFRQAVTLSKGAFKIVPARTKRAARVSLLDLGEEKKTDKVSWMDRLSLLDTMASRARIAQGLKDNEKVDKTTLSEMLNAESSMLKHFTVKQVSPQEPYRLKMHKDALYQTKPPNIDGFGEWKLRANSQMFQKMAMDTEELARRSAIYAYLMYSMVASVISKLSSKDERTKLLKEKLAVIQEAQVAAMSSGFAAAFNLQLLRRDALLKNFGFQHVLRGHMSLDQNLRYFSNVCVTSDTRTGCQDLQSLSRRRLKKLPHPKSAKRRQRPRHNRPDKSTHHSEDHHTGDAVLSCRVRPGRPSTSQCVPPSQAFWSNPGSSSRPTLKWHRWGLAWQALPLSGEACSGPVGPPTQSRKEWV